MASTPSLVLSIPPLSLSLSTWPRRNPKLLLGAGVGGAGEGGAVLQGQGVCSPCSPGGGGCPPHRQHCLRVLTALTFTPKERDGDGEGRGRGKRSSQAQHRPPVCLPHPWPQCSALSPLPPPWVPQGSPTERGATPHLAQASPMATHQPSSPPALPLGGQLAQPVAPWRVGPEQLAVPLERHHPPSTGPPAAGEGHAPFLGATR